MKFLFQAIAIAGAGAAAAAAPALAQGAAGQLEAMTCREFLALDADGQATVKAAMLAHLSGEPLPASPLPAPVAADAGEAASPDQAQVVEDQAGATDDGSAVADRAPQADAATGEGSSIAAPEVVAGENESGKVAPDGTEASVTDEPADDRLLAMRTSCEGGPDARALDALRAAFADNL